MKTITTLLLLLAGIQSVEATHLLGGYIQVKIPTNAAAHEINVVIYYNAGQAASVATSISLCFGDGTYGSVNRLSQQTIPASSNVSGAINVSTYRTTHIYAGPGTYTLTTALSNRTNAINILSNVAEQTNLTLTTTFTTGSMANQTPSLSIPASGFVVALNQRASLSFSATDTDGDSLVYGLARPLTSQGTNLCSHQFVSAYQFPNDQTHQGTFKLNNHTGELVWDAPVQSGYYSVAISISEYRNGVLIGQTAQEFPLIATDLPGTPTLIPTYESAFEGSVITGIVYSGDPDMSLTTFPNPVDDGLQVIIQSSNPTTATIQLLDVNGRKLHELAFTKLAHKHEQFISMDSLSAGVYLLRANVGDRVLVRKIVKR